MAASPGYVRTSWLFALLAILGLSGCATNSNVSPRRQAPVEETEVAAIVVPPESSLVANAAVSQGRGGYQRTSVPPEFLILMLGVPLLILLL